MIVSDILPTPDFLRHLSWLMTQRSLAPGTEMDSPIPPESVAAYFQEHYLDDWELPMQIVREAARWFDSHSDDWVMLGLCRLDGHKVTCHPDTGMAIVQAYLRRGLDELNVNVPPAMFMERFFPNL